MAEASDLLNETDPVEAPRWRNLWFLRDGRSYSGHLRFRSEGEAAAMGARWLDLATTGWVLMPDSSNVPGSFITHFIPMPVGAL